MSDRVSAGQGEDDPVCAYHGITLSQHDGLIDPVCEAVGQGETCRDCGGHGWVMEPGPERNLPNQIPCERCFGTGYEESAPGQGETAEQDDDAANLLCEAADGMPRGVHRIPCPCCGRMVMTWAHVRACLRRAEESRRG